MTTATLTAKALRAIAKHGESKCKSAFDMWNQGEGARTVGYEFTATTNQADAMINAGEELSLQNK